MQEHCSPCFSALTMTLSLDLPERYRQQLLALLEAYVPEAEAWAYGSRVQGTHHDASDLDVVLRGPNLAELGAEFLELVEAVRESTIPILIDVFDWARLPESFHREIEREYVVLKEARTWREPETVDAFGRSASIDLDPSHRRVVMRLLRGFVPSCEVRAYGPRAEWTAEQHSRLDIAVLGASNVNPYALTDLRAAFQRSSLPFSVNIVDWDAASQELRQQILRQYLVLQPSAQAVPNEWLTVTLGECGYLVRDSVDPAEFGDLPYIGLAHIREGTLQLTGVGQASDVTSTKTRFNAGDVLFGKLRPYFRKVVQPRFAGICSTDIWVLRSQEGVSQDYLFYLMASPEVVEQAVASSKGTRMPRADWKFVADQQVALGPLAEQHRIASVLRALDDRIELNRRMCETLEEMAQALFKSWFVDFEPVRAKMEGRWREGESLPGLPAHLYDLFSDHLVESELGPIPTGWRVTEIGEALELEYGRALKASDRKGGSIPVYGSNGQVGWHDRGFVKGPGIIVGRKGSPGAVCRSHTDFFPIDTTFYTVVRDPRLTFEYLYQMLRRQHLSSAATDSAVPGLNRSLAYANLYVRPTDEAVAVFTDVVATYWAHERSAITSARALRAIHDTLLPKLISGEMRLPDVVEAVEC